jgi:NTP pyrophosphatase (non-canonical NTP hydrolase)
VTDRELILHAINGERIRQDKKWGKINKKMLASMPSVLLEESGEVARAVLEKDHDNLQVELVQVAAVCVKWLEIILKYESLRRGKNP